MSIPSENIIDLVKNVCYNLTEVIRLLKERLEMLINTLGLKKGDFAEKVNFSQAYISMILSGSKQNPSDRFYESIKREFNVSVDWLRDGKGEMFVVDNPELSPIEKDLVTKYNSLPLSERKIIDEVVDALLIKYSKNADDE